MIIYQEQQSEIFRKPPSTAFSPSTTSPAPSPAAFLPKVDPLLKIREADVPILKADNNLSMQHQFTLLLLIRSSCLPADLDPGIVSDKVKGEFRDGLVRFCDQFESFLSKVGAER